MKRKIVAVLMAFCVSTVGFMPFESNPVVQPAFAEAKAPTITSAQRVKYDSIKLTWKSVEGADGYAVYRSSSKNGTYKRISTTKAASYNDKSAAQNKYYYYKVAAVDNGQVGEKSAYKAGRIRTVVSLDKVGSFKGKPYVKVNNNNPTFKTGYYPKDSFESYAALDSRGRCGIAYANVGLDTMPTEDRGSIGMIKPTGWHTVKYNCVDGKYLYNRCHLIGYQLTAENANRRNLITGTRYMNVDGMLPFENEIADYVEETGNHVLYRVVPVFKGSDLVARGVQMEAKSVEDKGAGISFNVFVYNAQPKIKINYATGGSSYIGGGSGSTGGNKPSVQPSKPAASGKYILNINSKVFHRPTCSSVKRMSAKNKKVYNGKRSGVVNQGYRPCKVCKP